MQCEEYLVVIVQQKREADEQQKVSVCVCMCACVRAYMCVCVCGWVWGCGCFRVATWKSQGKPGIFCFFQLGKNRGFEKFLKSGNV